eukprot:SAG31_NODE_271_length_18717_cov_8.685949_20_plen_81_part_00
MRKQSCSRDLIIAPAAMDVTTHCSHAASQSSIFSKQFARLQYNVALTYAQNFSVGRKHVSASSVVPLTSAFRGSIASAVP